MNPLYPRNLKRKSKSTEIQEEILIHKIQNKLASLTTCAATKARIDDIKTDLKELETKFSESDFKVKYLRNRERALQKFINDFPSMLGYWDKDLLNVHSNKIYAEYFGKKPEEIKGLHIKELLGTKIFKLNFPFVKNVLAGVPQTFERSIPTGKGKIKHTLANYVPHYVDNNVVGFFVSVTDISEKKELEEKTKSLEIALHDQSKMSSIGQMASGIAHEINNPMAIIYGNACILRKELGKSEIKKEIFLERLLEIESTALRVTEMVDGLRLMAGGQNRLPLEDNSVSEIVDQTLAICRRQLAKHNITVLWKHPETPIHIICHKVQISEIIINILNNALDALKNVRGAKVSISAKVIGGECHLCFANNGPPISPDNREKIFLPFFTTKGKQGTGLGLKISRDLAAANQGRLSIKASKKTEFILVLKLNKKPKSSR